MVILRSKVVHPAGLEPTTYCSGGSRSIQMSYGCIVFPMGSIDIFACFVSIMNARRKRESIKHGAKSVSRKSSTVLNGFDWLQPGKELSV